MDFQRLLEMVSADRKWIMNGISLRITASVVAILEKMARNLG
jgi:hypothetical protein